MHCLDYTYLPSYLKLVKFCPFIFEKQLKFYLEELVEYQLKFKSLGVVLNLHTLNYHTWRLLVLLVLDIDGLDRPPINEVGKWEWLVVREEQRVCTSCLCLLDWRSFSCGFFTVSQHELLGATLRLEFGRIHLYQFKSYTGVPSVFSQSRGLIITGTMGAWHP